MAPTRRPRRRAGWLGAVLGCAAIVPLLLSSLGVATAPGASGGHASLGAAIAPASAIYSPINLGTAAAPTLICEDGATSCPSGNGESRVELTATVAGQPTRSWPDVQVVFVIDTTSYAGDFGTDSVGLDPCAATAGNPLCEESNGIPFFVANAGLITSEIQESNPHSHVSFALIDYYDAWGSGWDDQDGPEYHVDIGSFVSAAEFPGDVQATFVQTVLGGGWDNWDQDMDNNFLDSSSITALYGAIVGSDLDWSPGAHHVIVWMGITAPRAPGYEQNYCVSASSWLQWSTPTSCYSQTCEPAYAFPTGDSPQCEGWTVSEDGNATHSIAALSKDAPPCVDSAGGYCVVDTIDLWGTPTDPYSKGWPTSDRAGSGPGGSMVWQNVERVLAAGCNMAAATGGSWDGPAWYTCADGQSGSLEYVPHGSITKPIVVNPTLLAAFREVSFGPIETPLQVRSDGKPLFQFVPGNGVTVAPRPDWATSCVPVSGRAPDCPELPSESSYEGVPAYGWNWSTNATANVLTTGDSWTAQFNIVGTGPTAATLPVDACVTTSCRYAGSGARDGLYSWANIVMNVSSGGAPVPTDLVLSFPVALVLLQGTPGATPLAPPVPSAPPIPPPPGIPVPASVPVAQPALVGLQTPSVVAQFQALSAGFLAAGFTRIAQKNRPVAVAVTALAGTAGKAKGRSRFER